MLLLLGGGLADQAWAKIITVVISGSAYGTLDGPEPMDFSETPAAFTWTITYDTSNTALNQYGQMIYIDPTSVIEVAGNPVNVTQEHGFWVVDTTGFPAESQELWLGALYMSGSTSGNNILEVRGQLPWNGISTPYTANAASLTSSIELIFTTDHGTLTFTAVSDTVTAVSATSSDYTFADWSGGATLTNPLLLKYAIGGATSPSGASEQSTVSSNGTVLSLTAVVRTDNSQLTISGEAVDTLSGVWSPSGVSSALAADQAGVSVGCERRVYSVPISGAKKFLRLRATLAP